MSCADFRRYLLLIKQRKEEIVTLEGYKKDVASSTAPNIVKNRAKLLADFTQKISEVQSEIQDFQQKYDECFKEFQESVKKLEEKKAAEEKAEAEKKAAEEKAAKEKQEAAEKAKTSAQPTAAQETKSNPQNPPAQPDFVSQAPVASVGTRTKSVSEDLETPPALDTETKTLSQQKSAEPVVSKIRPNALSGFSTYNYIIELQATDMEGLQNFQQSEKYDPADWVTLITSAGGSGGTGVLRNSDNDDREWFQKEYYLDDLEFTSIVGITNTARATADLLVNFNVIEPYGINFIQELWEYNAESLNCRNWTETCYLLKIAFKGYDDQGALILSEIVKYLPIKIINIEVKLAESGSIYTVSAYAFNQQAIDKKYGVLSKGVQCEGKTVKDIILGVQGTTDLDSERTIKPINNISNPPNLKTALNKETRTEATDNTITSVDFSTTEYDFEFRGDLGNQIAQSLISKPEQIVGKDTSMNLADNELEAQILKNLQSYQLLGRRNSSDIKITVDSQKVNFNAGQITEVLSQIIINSDYVTDQIVAFRKKYQTAIAEKNPDQRKDLLEKLKEPFKWFRIIPKIYSTGRYDQSNNLYQKRIVYQIVGYEIQNAKDVGGYLVPSSKNSAIEKTVVKEYNYFFTGKNSEILRLDINLNTNYWSYRPRNSQVYGQATGTKPRDAETEPTNINPNQEEPVGDALNGAKGSQPGQSERSSISMGNASQDRAIAGQVASSIYNQITQLLVEMEIMGDPDLFKQDGVYKSPAETDDEEIPIIFDTQEKYVRLTFTNPRDIDDSTGTLDKNNKTKEVVFSGLYVIMKIDNFFKQGKFTQQLTLRRVVGDPGDQTPEVKNIQKEAAIRGLKPVIDLNLLFEKFPPPTNSITR